MLTSGAMVVAAPDAFSGSWMVLNVLRPSLLAVRVALDVALPCARDRERGVGDVGGDDRPSGSVSTIAERDRGDERRVDARADLRADGRPGLRPGLGVVVGGDRRGAQVGTGADVRVADVGQVRDLRARADVGVLDLDERADLGVLAQGRPGA